MKSNSEVLIKCEHVSKKFCKDFKRSLWYGLKDVGLSFNSSSSHHDQLRKDEFWAVDNISFELKRGECLGLIGTNGAGKSTLLKMLNGLINPDKGKITMRGRVGALIELGAGFNPILTGRENIYTNGAVLGFAKKEIDEKLDAIIEFSEVGEFIDTPVQNYSSGMKVRLGFSIAAQMEPDILLIDEVLAVGDVGFVVKCMNRMSELISRTAVIFVSHSMSQVAKICTKGQLLLNGKTKYESADIQSVVTEYFKLFGTAESQTQGTGQAECFNVGVTNYNEKVGNLYVFRKPDNIEVNFKLRVSKEVEHIYVGLTFLNQEQRLVAVTNNVEDGVTIKNDKEVHDVSIRVPNLFSSLKYTVTLGVFEIKNNKQPFSLGKLLLRYSDFFGFINEGSRLPNYTPVQLHSKWEFS